MKGVYALIIRVGKRLNLAAGGLGKLTLGEGIYVYIGSAMGTGSTSLQNRLGRHFSDKKTIHWHIDYLLDANVEKKSVVWAETKESMECTLAQRIAASDDFEPGPTGFGASDCKESCGTHLFRQRGDRSTSSILKRVFERLELVPHFSTKQDFLKHSDASK